MQLKQLIARFTYRIEPKPEGGFIAHPSDPAVAPLEAATREELQQKIQTTITASLGAQFPALKPALEGRPANFAFHIERKPGGGFALHSADPQAEPIEFGTHNDLESHFAEKLVNFVGKHLAPELAQAVAAQGISGDINVTGDHQVAFAVKAGSHTWSITRDLPANGAQAEATTIDDANLALSRPDRKLSDIAQPASNKPITPESSGNWTMFLFILVLLTAAAIVYLLLKR